MIVIRFIFIVTPEKLNHIYLYIYNNIPHNFKPSIYHRNKQQKKNPKHDKNRSVLTKYIYEFTKMKMLVLFLPLFCASLVLA